jgi:hypothetical protein
MKYMDSIDKCGILDPDTISMDTALLTFGIETVSDD